jgi:glycosyltransferase domain-containing protein
MRDVLMVDYRRYSPGIDAYLKIARALNTVDSKYAVICADDDFIIPRAMENCAQFLEHNPDYAVAHGRLVSMFPAKDSGKYAETQLWTYDRSLRTVNSSDPRVRLYEFVSKCEGTLLYSVHRRLNLIHNAQIASKAARDYSFQCLLLECLSMIQGKLRCLDNLYGVRPYNPDSIGSTDISLRWDSLLTSNDFSQRYTMFHHAVAQELVKVARISKPEANEVVKNAFLMNLTRALYGTYENAISARRARGLKWTMPFALIQTMTAAARSAVLDKKMFAILRNPRGFARVVRLEHKQGYLSADRLLNPRTPFHSDFLPIYESVMKGPDGDATG